MVGTLERVGASGALALQADAGVRFATTESPKTAGFTREVPREALADMTDVAQAVACLVHQESRALTHELVVTPSGERWVPWRLTPHPP